MIVSFIVTCHNYGRYLRQCVESILAQSYPDLQIIIVNDGSTDDTQNVMIELQRENWRAIQITACHPAAGLAAASNRGIELSDGEYIVRVDADDWMNPNFALVLSHHLDTHPSVDCVYCDYTKVNMDEEISEIVTQPKFPLGSCMMYRRSLWHAVGGYSETLAHQEDYDLWIRINAREIKTHHVDLPLWYYRQHDDQMSRNHNAKHRIRHGIKEERGIHPKVLCVIPARGNSQGIPGKNLREIAGIPLVARAIRIAKDSGIDMLIAVSTENPSIAEVARAEGVEVIDRPLELSADDVSTIPVVKHAMEYMDDAEWRADIVISMQPTCPYTPPKALEQGLIRVHHEDIDSAVSVAEITGTHPYRAYEMARTMLEPLFPKDAEAFLQRQDRPVCYGFTGGFYIRKRALLEKWDGTGYALGRCSGVVVPEEAAVDIDSKLDLWLAEAIMKHQEDL